MLNGIPGNWINCKNGLRQGDPISPMLFILTMEPLQRMFEQATRRGILEPLARSGVRQRLSIYADDVALFVRPSEGDLSIVRSALHAFGKASELCVNYQKSSAILIRGSELDQA